MPNAPDRAVEVRVDALVCVHRRNRPVSGRDRAWSDLAHDRPAKPEITPREPETLALIVKGNANKEIGAQLGIAEDTVKQHVSRILQKLRVSDRAQATAEAIRRGLVKL